MKKIKNDKIINDIFIKSSSFDSKNKKLIKENGVVFTDKKICDMIIKQINPKIDEIVCEPSVGKGVFVFSLFEFFRKKHTVEEIVHFFNHNLYCYEINNDFLLVFKELVIDYFKCLGYQGDILFNNVIENDFLLQNKTYDVIIGNPPYVRIQNIETIYLNELKSELKSISLGNIDLYYAFLEKSLLCSKRVGFIIPNSFIKTKSGAFIRDIIKDRLSYIYDFKSSKVWDNISTYTSIVICDEYPSDQVQYQTNNNSINKNKNELSNNKWIFETLEVGNEKLVNMVNRYSGGLATIKDDVFKMDSYDDSYCYKNGQMIEKGICKKYIKATKSEGFNDYEYIIYPYVDGDVINEQTIMEQYPLCYQYLLSRKSELLSRDKGKTSKYESWFAYGRRQGLLRRSIGDCIILPLTFLKSREIHYIEIPDGEECLVLSGILVDIKSGMKDDFIRTIKRDKFYTYCELNNKTLPNKGESDDVWLSLTSTTIKEYMY